MGSEDTTLDTEGWPYMGPEGMIDSDSSLEAVALESCVLVAPTRRIEVHQETFSVSRTFAMSAEDAEEAWEAAKDVALAKLLALNGLKLTFDTYTLDTVDALFGRWTLEEITTKGA